MPRPPEESPMPMRSRPSMSAVPRGGLPAGMMGGGVVSLPTNMSYSGGGIVGYAMGGVPGGPRRTPTPGEGIADAARLDLERAKTYAEDPQVKFYVDRLRKGMEGMSSEEIDAYLSSKHSKPWESSPRALDTAVSLLRQRRQPNWSGIPTWVEKFAGSMGAGDVVQTRGQAIPTVEEAKARLQPAVDAEIALLESDLDDADAYCP